MTTVFIGGDKGGIGKDLVTEGIYIGAVEHGFSPRLYEVEVTQSMDSKFPDAVFVPTGAPSSEELYKRPDCIYEPLDRAAAAMVQDPLAIVNAGASVTTAFLKWSGAEVGKAFFGKGEDLHFVCPVTMQKQAMKSGFANLAAFGNTFPLARRTVVLNPMIADFIEGDRNIELAIETATGTAHPIEVVRLERMSAPAWGYLMNMGRLDEVATKSWKELVALGLPEPPSIRSMGLFEAWVKRFVAMLAPITLSEMKPEKRRIKKEK